MKQILFVLLLSCPVLSAFADGPCEASKTQTRKVLGKVRGTQISLVERNYEYHDDGLTSCAFIEYKLKGKLQQLEVASDDQFDSKSIESITLNKKEQLVIKTNYDGKADNINTVATEVYQLNPTTRELKEVSVSVDDPASRDQRNLMAHLKKAEFQKALKIIRQIDTCPNGNYCIGVSIFNEATPIFLRSLMILSSHPQIAQHIKNYLQAWKPIEAANTTLFSYMEGWSWGEGEGTIDRERLITMLPHWQKLAEYLALGGELELAQQIHQWLLKHFPGRFELHKAIGDVYQHQKLNDLAAKHHFIARTQEAAFTGKPLALGPTITLTPEEQTRFLAFKEVNGCLEFTTMALSGFTINVRNKDGQTIDSALKTIPLSRPACVQGHPLDPTSEVDLDEARTVRSGVLTRDFKIGPVLCGAGAGFFRRDGIIKCSQIPAQTLKGIALSDKSEVVLKDDGTPIQFTPARDFEFNGFSIAANLHTGTESAPGMGSVLELTLAREQEIAGVRWPTGTYFLFNGTKLPQARDLAKESFVVKLKMPLRLSGVLVQDRCYIAENLELESGLLAEDWKGPEGECAKGKFINLPNAERKQPLWCRPPLF